MDKEEINTTETNENTVTTPGELTKETSLIVNFKNTLIALLAMLFIAVASVTLGYRTGKEDTERRLKEPQINLSLVPSEGPVQVIPLKLTSQGVGIKFNTTVSNLVGIGIDFSNK